MIVHAVRSLTCLAVHFSAATNLAVSDHAGIASIIPAFASLRDDLVVSVKVLDAIWLFHLLAVHFGACDHSIFVSKAIVASIKPGLAILVHLEA